jgi:hypothetical protein
MCLAPARGQEPQWIYTAENDVDDPNTYAVDWWVGVTDGGWLNWCNTTSYDIGPILASYEGILELPQWQENCTYVDVFISIYSGGSWCPEEATGCTVLYSTLDPEREGLYITDAWISLNDQNFDFTEEGALSVIGHELGHVYGLYERYLADFSCNDDEDTVMDAAVGPEQWVTGNCDDTGGYPTALDISRIEDFYAANAAGNPRVQQLGRDWVIWAWDDSAWAENEYRLDVLRWAGTDWVQVLEDNHRGGVWQEPGGAHNVEFDPSDDPSQPDGYYMLCMCTYAWIGGCQNPICAPYVWLTLTPPSPSLVSLYGSNGSGSVSWDNLSEATYYQVFVERWNNGSTVTLLNWVYDTASPKAFTYSASDYYHAAVKACNAHGCSSQTNSNPYWVWLQAGPLLLLEDYFSSGSINTSLWGTAMGGGATIVQSGGYLQMSMPNVANAYADLYSKSYFAVGTTFEARVWVGAGQSYDHKGIGYASARVGADCGSGEIQAAMWRGQDRDKYTETKTGSSSNYCWFKESNYPSGWRTIKVERVSSSQVKFYENGSLIRTHSTYIPTGFLRIRFSAYTYTLAPSDYVTIWVDWVKVTQP